MRKIILSTALLATSLFALNDEELLSIYSGAPQDIKVELKCGQSKIDFEI